MTDLHPDLVPYIIDHELFGKTIDHPLVRFMPLEHEGMTTRANDCYKWKKNLLKKSVKERDWDAYVFAHERPYRVAALCDIRINHELTGREFWPVLGSAWVDSNNIWQNPDEWLELWSERMPYSYSVMDKVDRKAFKALPDEMTVWRGVGNRDAVEGLSWTTDRNMALWFAYRFMKGRKPHLAQGQVSKRDVLAHFTGRGESEIVVIPEYVVDITVEKLSAKSRDKFQEEYSKLKQAA